MDYQTALAAVESLPVADRVRLVEEVWDRLPPSEGPFVLTDELKAELDRRIEELDRHPEDSVPWEDVYKELSERYGW